MLDKNTTMSDAQFGGRFLVLKRKMAQFWHSGDFTDQADQPKPRFEWIDTGFGLVWFCMKNGTICGTEINQMNNGLRIISKAFMDNR